MAITSNLRQQMAEVVTSDSIHSKINSWIIGTVWPINWPMFNWVICGVAILGPDRILADISCYQVTYYQLFATTLPDSWPIAWPILNTEALSRRHGWITF
jgi:hypothetical protein